MGDADLWPMVRRQNCAQVELTIARDWSHPRPAVNLLAGIDDQHCLKFTSAAESGAPRQAPTLRVGRDESLLPGDESPPEGRCLVRHGAWRPRPIHAATHPNI